MTGTVGPARPMRADARRNYDRLLDAAKAAFAEHGTDAPLDDIAKRAGVGSGTLYRHFPTRTDLIEAVFVQRISLMVAVAAELAEGTDPEESLRTFMRQVVEQSITYRGLAGALVVALHEQGSEVARSCHTMVLEAADRLGDRAKQAGVIRADVNMRDLLKLVNGIAMAAEKDAGADPALVDRLIALILNGLRPTP
ncbi:TetR/AcrR family transcriptional regulator [Actinocrispum wychmicini]|uniref:TetR family transcriptional regulator n=1 Tax=Actinocrispum wychmicini TaxID=1213861 RepID=A0A4V2S7R3_9PSEU|nr:TetR/AcrR family transcriptional regulator [Actinocrispum wychmicini]TCO61030.1 TetR family transcriptional regulator [Actinocrispum wychmicini]